VLELESERQSFETIKCFHSFISSLFIHARCPLKEVRCEGETDPLSSVRGTSVATGGPRVRKQCIERQRDDRLAAYGTGVR
jgi:hypothetical protein